MATLVVPPSGRLDAKYVIVGEQPGRDEVKIGVSFCGPAGRNLDEALEAAGISRKDCYLTNVIKRFALPISQFITFTTGRNTRAIATDFFIESQKQLHEELSNTTAEVILACGNVALYALTTRIGITHWRGSFIETMVGDRMRKIIPMFHPATYTREKLYKDPDAYMNKFLCISDLKKAKYYTEVPTRRPIPRILKVARKFLEAMNFINECYIKGLEGKWICYDIETTRGNAQLACIGLAHEENVAMCIPLMDERGDFFTEEQEIAILEELERLFNNDKIVKVGQNVIFDAHFMLKRYGIRTHNLQDTMVAQGIISHETRKGLDFITSVHTDIPYYKADGKIWLEGGTAFEKGWSYNCLDVLSCATAIRRQRSTLQGQQNLATYENQVRLIEPLTYMMEHGIKVDTIGMKQAQTEALLQAQSLDYEARKIIRQYTPTADTLNFDSPQQMCEYFYHTRKLKPYYSQKTGNETVDVTALKRLSNQGVKEAGLILNIRRLSKKASTFLEVDKVDADGRIRCQYNPVGCVLPDTEVLTTNGWCRIDSIPEGINVLQWSSNGDLTWCVPEVVNYDVEDNIMMKCESEYHDCTYTIDHRIPSYVPNKQKLEIKSAIDTAQTYRQLPISGKLFDNNAIHFPDFLRIVAMIQADGCISGGNIILNFKKPEKAIRCQQLLHVTGLPYTTPKGNKDYYRYNIRASHCKELIELLGKDKQFGPWLLKFDQASLTAFIDEIRYWDAFSDGIHESYRYNTIHKNNAEWVATIAHLCGMRGSVRYREHLGYTQIYHVSISKKDKVSIKEKNWQKTTYTGKVWCLITPTEFFLARSNGKIFITGNTKFGRISSSGNIFGTGRNLQNQPHDVLTYLTPDEGYVLYSLDMSQIENRIVAYYGRIPQLIDVFEAGMDSHRVTGSLIFNKPYEQISDIAGSCDFGDGTHSERDWSKRANHGFNYGYGPRSFSLKYEIPEAQAKWIHGRYHRSYPGLAQNYWLGVEQSIRNNHYLENLLGHRIYFLGQFDPLEAYAAIPQSTCAELMNFNGINFTYYNTLPCFESVELLTQIHDSMEIQMPLSIPINIHAQVLVKIKESLECDLTIYGRTFHVPVDLVVNNNMNKETGVSIKGSSFSSSPKALEQELAKAFVKLGYKSTIEECFNASVIRLD